jgi:hypothetical protein
MRSRLLPVSIAVVAVLAAGAFLILRYRPVGVRAAEVFAWMRAPDLHANFVIAAGTRCDNAPFEFPTTGVVGFLWDDSFRPGHRHQGLDIFSGTAVDVTPVVAVYPGYVTRLPDWKSTVIERIPSDPLQPNRQIWVYYTHMADPLGNSFVSDEFPPGTSEKPVDAGKLLGYQGDYSGDPNNPVGVHLHISIVRDAGGQFLNELDIKNTYDPSPYFGMPLNARLNRDRIPACASQNVE